ncbi:MAG: LysR substrate-binding domain-containing protein, partial [Pseudomonadota bacterium]
EAFEQLRVAYAPAGPETQSTLTISTTPSFASNWLAAHIGHFQLAHPDLAVRVEANPTNVAFDREEVDVAIRYGRGDWPGLTAHRLMATEFTPMLSPALLAEIGEVSTPGALLSLRRINPADGWWRIWFSEAGIPLDKVDTPVSHLSSQTEEAQAAMAGHGLAILSPGFFRHELETGRLVQPFDQISSDGAGHWLVYQTSRRTLPKIKVFRSWITKAAHDAEAA